MSIMSITYQMLLNTNYQIFYICLFKLSTFAVRVKMFILIVVS